MPLLRRRAKTEGVKDYIGFADEHPALAASGAAYQAAEDAESADAEKGRGDAETPTPAGLQGAEKRSLGRLLRRHSTGTTATACSGGSSTSGSGGIISGAHLSGGAAGSSSDGSDHGSAASLRVGQMMNGSAASAGAASRNKGKGVAVAKLGLRIGAVKAKVASFQLLIAESASISSSTTTRYMRSSDTAADELRVASQTGTPTPRGKRPRESLHLNLLAGGGDGAQTASSAVAVQPQD